MNLKVTGTGSADVNLSPAQVAFQDGSDFIRFGNGGDAGDSLNGVNGDAFFLNGGTLGGASIAGVPEPGSIALFFGFAGLLLAFARRRRSA
jgi:hypothetical protein